MGKLTGTKHGDKVSVLLGFYQTEADKLESLGSYFMAAVTLGAALETALLGYMLVEWDEDNEGELEVPDKITMEGLIQAAKHFDLLNAVRFKETEESPQKSVENVIHDIQQMRNYLHPAKALRKSFNPALFDAAKYQRLRKIYTAVTENLLHNL